MLGACVLLRRAMLDEIGGFDERFPMYGEDIELQYRAQRAGWERWYVPDAVAVHDYQRVDRPPRLLAPHAAGTSAAWRASCAGTRRPCCSARF